MNPHSLTQQIKGYAVSDAGFDLAGICAAERLPSHERIYGDWLQQGYSGSMEFLKRSCRERTDPRRVFPNARSVICLAVNYFHPDDSKPSDGCAGRIAKFAYGQDYHGILSARLEKLTRWIETVALGCSFEAKAFVDSGPLSEKAFARQAGIGFYGKHTMLISREYGSWIFLAALITNLELEADNPAQGDCGSCSDCVKACPTGALLGNYRMDARRCIAYLTIESKETVFPNGNAKRLGDQIFGCDICQQACPHNDVRMKMTRHEVFYPKKIAGTWLEAKSVLKIRDAGEFNERFGDSPLSRVKLKRLRRNAVAVQENLNAAQSGS